MTEPLLIVDSLTRRYGSLEVVKNVSFQIAPGERHAVIGPNGAGKSTVFNMISGTVGASSGSLSFDGRSIGRLTDYQRTRLGIVKTFQHSQVFLELDVRENVLMGLQRVAGLGYSLRLRRRAMVGLVREADDLLERVGLGDRSRVRAGELSHGERRQLEVAIALSARPKLLLLDEPAAGMSLSETERFVGIIKGLPRDITVVITEHDMDVVFELAERITVLHLGEVLMTGTPAQVAASEEVRRAYFGDPLLLTDSIEQAS